MPACVVNGCSPANRGSETLHVFPKDKGRIRIWLLGTGQYSDNLEEAVNKIFDAKKSDTYRMCAKHFAPYCYIHNPQTGKKKLTKNAVPTIFPPPNVTDEPATTPPAKRKRGEKDRIITNLQPGDCCPTCFQVIPLPVTTQASTSTAEKSVTHAEKATEFYRFFGTLNKRIQNTPRTFSVKTQCTLLKSRLRRPMWKTSQSKATVLPKVGEKSVETLVDPSPLTEANIKNVEPSCKPVTTPDKSSDLFQVEEHTFHIVLPEIPPLSPIPFVPPAAEVEEEPHILREEQSTSHRSQDSDSESSTEDSEETDDSQEDEGEDDVFSERNLGDTTPYYVHPVKQRKFIVFENSLDELILKIPCQTGRCTNPITKIVKIRTGSFISISAECADRHYNLVWESQPKIDGKPLGNIILASAILASGNSFLKMKQFFHLANIMAVSENAYSRYQRDYIFPTITHSWKNNQMEHIENLQEAPVCIIGDGQWDSSGDAKFCLYSMMDNLSKKVISFDIKRLAMGVSSNELEKLACKHALDFVLQNEVDVKLLCTDRNFSIRKMIKEEFSTITHEVDAWHLSKSVGEKLSAASKEKNCEDLAEWVRAIRRHLRWCSNTYDGDDALLIAKWRSLLYHVQNVHSWEDKDSKYTSCHHDHLPEDTKCRRKWLKTDSPSFRALKNIVTDKRLQKDIKRICHFCYTGDLEVFHNAIVKYQSDQPLSTIDDMYARTQLAALDHNANCRRIQTMVKRLLRKGPGYDRYKMAKTQVRKEQFVKAMYEPNNQDFLMDLLQEVVEFVAGNRIFDEWRSHTSPGPEDINLHVKVEQQER
ncbi:uncharacterized protein [Dendropsophus ebraccatus]|uniref:uncharacterized protein isoform X1 n=1 Tax=Dendropsophus ebraccatus TaxID=150705 RepID=UPI00383228F6